MGSTAMLKSTGKLPKQCANNVCTFAQCCYCDTTTPFVTTTPVNTCLTFPCTTYNYQATSKGSTGKCYQNKCSFHECCLAPTTTPLRTTTPVPTTTTPCPTTTTPSPTTTFVIHTCMTFKCT